MEYLIVNSRNEWLSTATNKKEAEADWKKEKARLIDDKDDTEIFFYEAKEIKSFSF